MVTQISDKEKFEELIKSDKLTVVDFYADWCGPCKKIAPQIVDMATKYPNVTFCKVNVDELEELAAKCEISAMPTFQFYKNGVKVEDVIGASIEKVSAAIEKHA